ncbi:MAG: hypothetical protein JO090_05910, partial [Rhizobacter sp.]|nr:hypothetical protein [Rhizobacter sp.]
MRRRSPARPTTGLCVSLGLLALAGCTEYSLAGPGGGSGAAGSGPPTPPAYCDALAAAGAALDGAAHRLVGAPLAFAPTTRGFGLSVVLEAGSPATLGLRIRSSDAGSWGEAAAPVVRATDLAQWKVEGLAPGKRYEYEVV